MNSNNAIMLALLMLSVISCTSKKKEVENSNFIQGLSPVDVYSDIESHGFSVNRDFSEYGYSWICKKSINGTDFIVDMYSSDKNNLENVRATAIIDVINQDIAATQQFFSYIASLPYEGSEPQKSQQWIIENFNNDKSTITIANVIFTISAPTKYVRVLYIEKEK